MPERLDTDTLLLHSASGQPLAEDPPGLGAFAPPRRTARGRERDRLYLCLMLRARASSAPNPQRYAELLDLAAATFYGSPGSVTAALRQALAAVNQDLLDHNLKESAGGVPMQGGLVSAALRGGDFYAVQGGLGLLLVAHKTTVERFPTLSSRPLGLSNALDAHYFHTVVEEGEYFLLSGVAHPGWNEKDLAGLGGLATLTHVVERLKSAAAGDIAALVGRFEPGGTLAPLKPAPAAAPRGAAVKPTLAIPAMGLPKIDLGSLTTRLRPQGGKAIEEEPVPAEIKTGASTPAPLVAQARSETTPALESPETISPPLTEKPIEPVSSTASAPPVVESAPVSDSLSQPETTPAHLHTPTPESPTLSHPLTSLPPTDWSSLLQRAERLGSPEPAPSIPVIEETPPTQGQAPRARPQSRAAPSFGSSARASFTHGFQSLGRALGVLLTRLNRGWRTLVARMLPEGTRLQQDGLFAIPASVQIGIAVVIPLAVVALAAFLYIQQGRAEQFNDILAQAQVEIATGRALPDAASARPHWERALEWLAQAEALRPGDEKVAQFRGEAQGKLDALDGVARLDYQPLVVGGLGREVAVKQIVLAGQDVYALDEAHNRILRLTPAPNNAGYTLDLEFECASGVIGDFTIGALVDMGLLPGPNVIGSEAVIALDAQGGLLYCAPESKPLAAYLPTPESGWIRPAAFEVYADRLYVLDPGGNEVWQFLAAGGAFNQSPARYFTGLPYDLQTAIDFSIAGGDLFLLRSDGRVTGCTRAASGQPPACTDSLQFSDQREGRRPGDRLADVVRPARLYYDPPPEPSLYLLDADTAGLYQLSLKLAFVRQYRARRPLGAPITSAAIDPAKQVFVGAGDNVYFAPRP